MQTTIRTIGDVTVITLDGRLDGGSAAAIQAGLESQIAAQGKILLDLRRTSYVSSAGLRLLLLLYRQVRHSGGRMAITGVTDEVHAVLTATGFLSFFTVADTVQDGVERLAA